MPKKADLAHPALTDIANELDIAKVAAFHVTNIT
jgi:hypothetical protein